jgi:phosphatidate cytidylyltransferase
MRLYTDMGAAGLFVVLGSVWVCDTVAYGVGKSLGTHPIVPTISPNKTWEGTIAGFVGAVAAGTALTPWLTGGTIWIGVGAGALVGVFAQLSDLVESALKRDAGVKDAGGLIPGHGGLLDRVDSLILTAPVLYYYLGLVGR